MKSIFRYVLRMQVTFTARKRLRGKWWWCRATDWVKKTEHTTQEKSVRLCCLCFPLISSSASASFFVVSTSLRYSSFFLLFFSSSAFYLLACCYCQCLTAQHTWREQHRCRKLTNEGWWKDLNASNNQMSAKKSLYLIWLITCWRRTRAMGKSRYKRCLSTDRLV